MQPEGMWFLPRLLPTTRSHSAFAKFLPTARSHATPARIFPEKCGAQGSPLVGEPLALSRIGRAERGGPPTGFLGYGIKGPNFEPSGRWWDGLGL